MSALSHRTALLQTLSPGELLIHEIYRSLQGESAYAGLPCVFVRTTQCDYRCSWCDTPHSLQSRHADDQGRGAGESFEL